MSLRAEPLLTFVTEIFVSPENVPDGICRVRFSFVIVPPEAGIVKDVPSAGGGVGWSGLFSVLSFDELQATAKQKTVIICIRVSNDDNFFIILLFWVCLSQS